MKVNHNVNLAYSILATTAVGLMAVVTPAFAISLLPATFTNVRTIDTSAFATESLKDESTLPQTFSRVQHRQVGQLVHKGCPDKALILGEPNSLTM